MWQVSSAATFAAAQSFAHVAVVAVVAMAGRQTVEVIRMRHQALVCPSCLAHLPPSPASSPQSRTVAAHSTVRALFANCDGPLYDVTRASDNKVRALQGCVV